MLAAASIPLGAMAQNSPEKKVGDGPSFTKTANLEQHISEKFPFTLYLMRVRDINPGKCL
jgi:hypothetical protein